MKDFDLKKYLAESKLLEETREEDYYNLLMDLGGTELAGDTFEDMMYKRGKFVSFEEFLDDELDFFEQEGDDDIIKRIKDKYLSEGKLLNEDRSSISLFMEDMLGDFLQFVVTVEEGLEAKYDNPEDLMLLKKKKEAMLDAMDSYVEFLVIIDEKSEALDIDKQ